MTQLLNYINFLDYFKHDFFIYAVIASIFIGLSIPNVGKTIVFKRVSVIGDTLSHASLVGVVLGLIINNNSFSVYIGALLISISSVLMLEFVRKKYKKFSDISLVIVMSLGLALSSILANKTKIVNLETYLFGSITLITKNDLIIILIMTSLILLFCIYFYKQIYIISFDSTTAKLFGVKYPNLINIAFMIIVAITVSVSVKIIGGLMLSTILILPTAASIQVTKSYFKLSIFSSLFGFLFMISGLFLSTVDNIFAPGPATVLIAVLTVIALFIFKFIIKYIFKLKNSKINI